MSPETPRRFRVVALIAAYNEADVVDAVIADLVRQGLEIYFIDNQSTDMTPEIARGWLGRGVIGLEIFPATGPTSDRYRWGDLLRRKEELAADIEADWFIHHDADEFRESPWTGCDLLEAIELVDRQGYNAIDFEVFHFRPTDDGFRPGEDVRKHLTHYQQAADYDRLQIGCWKKLPGVRVDLASEAGHDVAFPGRRVFPIRFLLRHYPVRSQTHGERKIHSERIPRFLPEENALGWHRQYGASGHAHLAAIETLTPYDPATARLAVQIENRRVEEVKSHAPAALAQEMAQLRSRLATAADELRLMTGARDAYAAEVEVRGAALAALQEQLRVLEIEHRRRGEEIGVLTASQTALAREVEARAATLTEMRESRTWRWSAPLRRLITLLSGGGRSRL